MMINNWVQISKLTATLNSKNLAMMSKFTIKNQSKKRKYTLTMTKNSYKKTSKKSMKQEKPSFRKSKTPSEKKDRPENKEDNKDIKINKLDLSQADSDLETKKMKMNKTTSNSQLMLKLMEKSSLTIHWLSLMTMTIMCQIMMRNLKITKIKKLILMKSLMGNCLMMMHTSFLSP